MPSGNAIAMPRSNAATANCSVAPKRLASSVRGSQVASGCVHDPAAVAQRQRIVQPKLYPKRLYCRVRRDLAGLATQENIGGVTRREVGEAVRQQRDTQPDG